MDPGQIIHIVVTVVAIVSAAAAALLCDLLRTENARLRQANLALLAERHEVQRRLQRDQEKSLKAVEVVTALPSAEPRSLEAGSLALDTGPPAASQDSFGSRDDGLDEWRSPGKRGGYHRRGH